MQPNALERRATDPRGVPRTSIYLAAALYCDGASVPVKIRNISAKGALIEGTNMPGEDMLVQLVRGSLIVHGLVAWSIDGRCGVRFSGSIDVDHWRSVPGNVEQQRVDEVVRLVKAGAVPLPVPPLEDPTRCMKSDLHLSAELRRASDLLDRLGEVLASDAEIVTRHAPALQTLDIAIQVIAAVEGIIEGHHELDEGAAKLAALRRSAEQALNRNC